MPKITVRGRGSRYLQKCYGRLHTKVLWVTTYKSVMGDYIQKCYGRLHTIVLWATTCKILPTEKRTIRLSNDN